MEDIGNKESVIITGTNIQMLNIIVNNIQHHEKMRNGLYIFYLILIGGYFLIFNKESFQNETKYLFSFFPLFLYWVGIMFTFSLLRYDRVIRRDVVVLSKAMIPLLRGSMVEQIVYKQYRKFYATRESQRLFKITVTQVMVTSMVMISTVFGVISAIYIFPDRLFRVLMVVAVLIITFILPYKFDNIYEKLFFHRSAK